MRFLKIIAATVMMFGMTVNAAQAQTGAEVFGAILGHKVIPKPKGLLGGAVGVAGGALGAGAAKMGINLLQAAELVEEDSIVALAAAGTPAGDQALRELKVILQEHRFKGPGMVISRMATIAVRTPGAAALAEKAIIDLGLDHQAYAVKLEEVREQEKAAPQVAGQGNVASEPPPGCGPPQTERDAERLFDRYLEKIQSISGINMTYLQKEMLKYNFKRNFGKISKSEIHSNRDNFDKIRSSIINTWSRIYNIKWPVSTKNGINRRGEVIDRIGNKYDAHHIIPLQYGGANDWWNIFPMEGPEDHQLGIHKSDELKDLKKFIENGGCDVE